MLPTLQEIVDATLTVCGVDTSEFLGDGRMPPVVLAREVAVAAMRRYRSDLSSFPVICRALHRPNHSTAVTAWQRYERDQHKPIGISGFEGLTRKTLVDKVWETARKIAAKRAAENPVPNLTCEAPPPPRTKRCPLCNGKGHVQTATAEAFLKLTPRG